MSREDIEKLLGGYATGTLTPEERQALFAAALEDQALFDELMREEALREVLSDPAGRAELLGVLGERPQPWYRRLGWWPAAAAAGVAFAGLAVAVYVNRSTPVTVAQLRVPPPADAEAPPRTPPTTARNAEPPAAPPPPKGTVAAQGGLARDAASSGPGGAPLPERQTHEERRAPQAQAILRDRQSGAAPGQPYPNAAQARQELGASQVQQLANQQSAAAQTRQRPSEEKTQQYPDLFQSKQKAAAPEAQPAPAVIAEVGEAKKESKDQRASATEAVAAGQSADKVTGRAAPAASRMAALAKSRAAAPLVRIAIFRRDTAGRFEESVAPTGVRRGETLRIVLEAREPGYLSVLEREPGGRWQVRESAQVQGGTRFSIMRTYRDPGSKELYATLSGQSVTAIASLDPLPEGVAVTLTVR